MFFRRSNKPSVIVQFDASDIMDSSSSGRGGSRGGSSPSKATRGRRTAGGGDDAEAASTCSTASVSTRGSLHSVLSSALSSARSVGKNKSSKGGAPATNTSSLHSRSTASAASSSEFISHQEEEEDDVVLPTKQVMISLAPTVHYIEGPTTEEDIHERWYDKHDYDAFRDECLRTIDLVQKCQREELEEKHCTRGVEGLSRAGSIRCKKQRNYAKQSVLSLQEQYHSKGLSDSAAIAEAYQKATKKSVTIALSYARKDEEEAALINAGAQ
mmetsp:Transcript_23740/g.67083  ORF Transcript_23740/g.67083 Transcript_23740/m.67083 type:complete len:270 (-) Transcript_23740:158-967(-)|eukprot:CAMPEP_0119560872 /NCGR_PEP_ID=MMETSP1352-20130426/16084_1 /TAXON_ID=265584 /ORGANISM="Stauroneis constricta, Strain CCMP1120" /LENGTH=269 /DNA_ID=CAMNT_0007608939 /DNA_START=112 /DNA_END=921 /DNA_ORIENTATION=-